ncbi:hypothetical protein Pfo_015079 [Paulownia fortunei]|nr:hypothetical protein Pfo_015079 [Paulownia fortunei]
MTTQASTKVRLVRCPKCRQVLAELPEVPLYKCGGCGTILQAKNRKLETNNTELSSQEIDSVAKCQQDNVFTQKEARSSDHDFTSPPKVESSLDKDNIKCQDENGDCMKLCEDKEDSSLEVNESLKHNPLGQKSKRYHSKFRDDNGEWTEGRNLSDELPSSGTPKASEHVEQHKKSHLHQDSRVDEMEGGESQRQEGDNFVDEVQNLPEHEDQESVLPPEGIKNKYVPPEKDEKSQICFTDQNGDFHGGIKPAGLDSSSGIVSHENDNISQSVGQSIEADDGAAGLPIFRRSSIEKNMNASVSDSIVASESALNESLVSFYLTSPDEEHLDHFPREVTHNFGRVSSVDTFGSSHLADLSSDLNFKHGSMTNYPTNGSYFSYYGSDSSYDGTDDQIREYISHPSRKDKDVDYISTTEVLRKDGFRGITWYTSGNRMRLGKQGGVSRLPFTSRDPLAGRRTVSPSSYRHNLLPPRPGFNSSDKLSCSEPDKIDLLRTVCELKDQLNRMHFPKVTTNRRFPAGVEDGKFTPFHYDHLAPEREIYADLDHPSVYNLRHNQAKGCAKRCNVSRLAFSGEAAHYRHQVSCSCLHCCPQDWHYSAQLPSHSMHCKNGHCVVHADHNCCNISSLSPQHYTSSELSLWGCETKSDNQRHDEIKRLHLKEKYHAAKRHLRPIAGGAPVVACYHCSELLQLPADFLLFKKKYHQVMCNACRKVLKFSLQKGTHIVPYFPDASAPPPSEADDYNDATSRRNLEPFSHSCSCQHVEPVSCSDDYGRSFCRSCSTEGEASVILPSFDQVERKSYNRKMSSGSSSYGPMEDRKMKSILREHQNKNESSLTTVESVGPSSKMSKWRKPTSEIEELPPLSNSPLHRLMGYSSPSQVLNK